MVWASAGVAGGEVVFDLRVGALKLRQPEVLALVNVAGVDVAEIGSQQVQRQGVAEDLFHRMLHFGALAVHAQRLEQFDARRDGKLVEGVGDDPRGVTGLQFGQLLAGGDQQQALVVDGQGADQRGQAAVLQPAAVHHRQILQRLQPVEDQQRAARAPCRSAAAAGGGCPASGRRSR
jgi:hypothetical protein